MREWTGEGAGGEEKLGNCDTKIGRGMQGELQLKMRSKSKTRKAVGVVINVSIRPRKGGEIDLRSGPHERNMVF